MEQHIKNKIKKFSPTSRKINIYEPNLSEISSMIYKFKDEQNNNYKILIFKDKFKLETNVKTSLIFSINYPDYVCLANKLKCEIVGIGKIFTNNSKDKEIENCLSLLDYNLKLLKFENNEGITIYRNAIQFTLNKNRDIITEINVCNEIKLLLEKEFPDIADDYDYSDIPINLKKILLKFENLAISDNYERDEKINKLTDKEIKKVIKILEPLIIEINVFLNSFDKKPLSDGAIKLQDLMLLTIELKLNNQKNNG